MRAIGVAMWGLVANPVGLTITAIVAGLAALGLWVKNNAAGISTFFSSFSESFMKALGPGAAQTVTSITTALQSVWDWVNKILGPIDATGAKWKTWGEGAGQAAASIVNALSALPGQISALGSQLMAAGSAAMQSLWDGMKSVAGKIVEWASGIAAKIAAPFKAIGGVLRGLGGGASQAAPSAPAPLQARARGGPVQTGVPYLVGERGPEIFVPNRTGMIETNHSYRRLSAAGSLDGRSTVRAPSASEVGQAGASGTGSTTHVTRGDLNVQLHVQAGGGDATAIAREAERAVRRVLARYEYEQCGMLSD